jgi:hypothetical protein
MATKEKVQLTGTLPVTYFQEDKMFVAHTSALDISSCGLSLKEAKENFIEAVSIFFEECIADGTLDTLLSAQGWKKEKRQPVWNPPSVIKRCSIPLKKLALV